VIPAAPSGVEVKGVTEATPQDAADSCDADSLPEVDPAGGVTISWVAVDSSHATLGREPATLFTSLFHTPNGAPVPIEVLSYEVVVEVDETPLVTTAIIPGDATGWTFSEDFFDLAEGENVAELECTPADITAGVCIAEYKFEILVRINNGQLDLDDNPIPGNRSAVESCFEVVVGP